MKAEDKRRANLRDITSETASEMGKKGGVASGIARKKRKALREELSALLSGQIMFDGKKRSMNEAISLAIIKRAMDGDPSAFKIIRETLGEDAPTQVDLNATTESAISFNNMTVEQIATLLADAKKRQ